MLRRYWGKRATKVKRWQSGFDRSDGGGGVGGGGGVRVGQLSPDSIPDTMTETGGMG